ncbi:actin protein ARPC3 [Fomitopsis schrenkii]|uniref:Actin-related protein 2/3 complex subunit n=1 Tax=Fomitopsis schrenkii TaxID=2126942 RepID=S8EIM7_FOMSC|nr:actin protein ARPC3 [Fomitopsis schrenkii]
MAPPELYALGQNPTAISSHAFNANRTEVAVSLNSNDATIWERQGHEWKQTETLAEHDKLITSIDWAPNSNRIVTCAQDRNAYVWQQSPDPQTGRMIWKPTLVLLRINRAATHVRWSPNEDKFAVASGARAIAICSFDPEGDWWVSRLLKKPIRSTVLSVDWHPNNVLLAAGSADMKARVFSAYIKDVDKRPGPCVWGDKFPFNTICAEYTSHAGGWVHSVGFSPSGDVLAFASHDSSVSIAYPGADSIVYTIKLTSLPLLTLAWTSENSLIAAGHDCQPLVFSGSHDGWELSGTLDDPNANKTGSGAARAGLGGASPVGRLNSAAFNTFRNADSRGISNVPGSSGPSAESELFTVHQNTITSVRAYEGAPGDVARVSTSGVDGKLVVWDVAQVSPISVTSNIVGRLAGVRI